LKEIAATIIATVFLSASVIFLSGPQTGAQDDNCDPSYPDVCIPPYPPDLNCPEVAYKDFTVLPPDPHGFDRDADGSGCET
jgi:micrococcal nuclease